MKHFNFRIWHSGYGETKQEAWEDATLSFALDPGGPPSDEDIQVEEIDPDTHEPLT